MADLHPGLMALLVGAGGAAGALARYYVAVGMNRLLGNDWPFGTLSVNLLGSLILGILAAFAVRNQVPPVLQAAAMVGFLGAFTTFSTFSVEAVKLFKDADSALSPILYVGLSVGLGISLAWIGYAATSHLSR